MVLQEEDVIIGMKLSLVMMNLNVLNAILFKQNTSGFLHLFALPV